VELEFADLPEITEVSDSGSDGDSVHTAIFAMEDYDPRLEADLDLPLVGAADRDEENENANLWWEWSAACQVYLPQWHT
jgi:hypothetical protein